MLEQASGDGAEVKIAEEGQLVAMLVEQLQKGTISVEPGLEVIKTYATVLDKYDMSHLYPQVSASLRQQFSDLPSYRRSEQLAYFAGSRNDFGLFTYAVQQFKTLNYGSDCIRSASMGPKDVQTMGPVCYCALKNAEKIVDEANILQSDKNYWRFVAGCLEFESI